MFEGVIWLVYCGVIEEIGEREDEEDEEEDENEFD